MRARTGLLPAALIAAAMVTFAPEAEAQDIIRPSTRPWWFGGGIGPSIHVTGAGGFTQFMLTQEIGGHFSGDGEGPALGAHLSESFGSSFFRFSVGPKFWYDIQPADRYAVYVTPDAQIGYTLLSNGGTSHAANVQFGCAGRVVLGDRGLLFFRPVAFDINFNDNGAFLVYNLLMGGGVTW